MEPISRDDFEDWFGQLNLRHFSALEVWGLFSGRSEAEDGTVVRNRPPPASLLGNGALILKAMDYIRMELGYPIHPTSFYRRPEYNAAIGGSPSSQHMDCRAIDWVGGRGEVHQWKIAANYVRGKRLRTGWELGQPDTMVHKTETFFDRKGLQIGRVAFTFRGGLGTYAYVEADKPDFIHTDVRGYDADWKKGDG